MILLLLMNMGFAGGVAAPGGSGDSGIDTLLRRRRK